MDDKSKDIKKALEAMSKSLGTSVVDYSQSTKLEAQSTGSISLDEALGIGGLPRGRVVELYGPESSGKTTIALSTAAQVQKAGGAVLFIDAENALGPAWAQKLGVDLDPLKFPIIQENCAELVFDTIEKAVDQNVFDLIIVDSVTSLCPRQEIEGTMDDQTIGLQARIISKGMRKLVNKVGHSRTIVIFVNQIREKVGVMFGNPETTSGGRALKFYSSIRMRVTKSSKEILGEDKSKVGHEIQVKIEKNKVAPPYREAHMTLLYNEGLDSIGEIFDVAMLKNVISRSGPTYTYKGQSWRGQEAVKSTIRSNEALRADLLDQIKLTPTSTSVAVVADEEQEPEEVL